MKIRRMLGDVLAALLRRPVTQHYPAVRQPTPIRLRGRLEWDRAKCTGCALCAKDCPADALQIITVDKAAKKFVMVYHVDRCTFCAQCVESCRFGCPRMSPEAWELAALRPDEFTLYYGADEDVRTALARLAAPAADGRQP